MADNTREHTRLLTNAKNEGAVTVRGNTQSSAADFDRDHPRHNGFFTTITVTRDWIVAGNGKIEAKLISPNGENKSGCIHRTNDYKQYAQDRESGENFGWSTGWAGNPEAEEEIIQIVYASCRGYSDRRAPSDWERYGQHDDGSRKTYYERDRAAYYHAWVAWRDAGYPMEVTVRDADFNTIEQYTITIDDAWESVVVEAEVETVVVEIKNYDCPHCGRRYHSYAGRYNHLRKNQCSVLNQQ